MIAALIKWLVIHMLIEYVVPLVAALKFHVQIPTPNLNRGAPNKITFDPLGIAAILHNPRAERSAARLYTTTFHDKNLFRWPHTTMFGGALTPLQTLVQHLSSNMSSLHPAVTLSMKDTETIPVISDMFFNELQLNFSSSWLRDIAVFKSSDLNDIAIVLLRNVDMPNYSLASVCPVRKLIIDMTGFAIGLLLMAGVVFSLALSDVWATVLFIFYCSHWLVSTVISFAPLVSYSTPKVDGGGGGNLMVDHYAVYERPEGGMVVLKGPKIVFEALTRSRWEFEKTPRSFILHWAWMITGTFSAISSVACMVNMTTQLQLVFLAVLSYSSLAEIWVTQLARTVQAKARCHARNRKPPTGGTEGSGIQDYTLVQNKNKRACSIIYATLGVGKRFRLDGLDWIKTGLLPESFNELQILMDTLREYPNNTDMGNIVKYQALARFRKEFAIQDDKLIEAIETEVEIAWHSRLQAYESELNC